LRTVAIGNAELQIVPLVSRDEFVTLQAVLTLSDFGACNLHAAAKAIHRQLSIGTVKPRRDRRF
jgi:hypothetical protein